MTKGFEAKLESAIEWDRDDKLRDFRSGFHFPETNGQRAIYFCGNSLGLQPKNAEPAVIQELDDWKKMAVGGYLHAKNPWLYYQHQFCQSLSAIVGCDPGEVTVMNTLTVNLHLLLFSFYHPNAQRYKILMEAGAFPSDQYAIETQVRFHGFDPDQAIIEIGPRDGEKLIREEDIIDCIGQHGQELAVVLLGGINYYSGQFFDIPGITAAAHRVGAIAGFDLAHVAGNIPLSLHDWNVDFAVWCSYKYLNAGPGATGGVYIREQFCSDPATRRIGGWWGNDEKTRFKMEKGFIPKNDAAGWNISTAQVLNMVCLKASLEIFDQAGMQAIREKSIALTGYLEFLLQQINHFPFQIITPNNPEQRGAQLSLFFPENGKLIHEKMTAAGIVVDYREPGVIRVAPAPLYNSFEDVFRFYEILTMINT